MYNVTYYATWSGICHPDYYFDDSKWSPFSAVSHDHRYQVRDVGESEGKEEGEV